MSCLPNSFLELQQFPGKVDGNRKAARETAKHSPASGSELLEECFLSLSLFLSSLFLAEAVGFCMIAWLPFLWFLLQALV